MKTFTSILLLVLFFSQGFVFAQELDFSAETQMLIPDENYLSNADWEQLFYDESQENTAARLGIKKPVYVAADGSVFISDRYSYSITKLDKTGKKVKTFGKKGWNPGEFASNQTLQGMLDDKYLIFTDGQGRINFFDIHGVFVKMITIDFMALNIYPVKGGKMIIQGHVPYGDKSKKLLAELDFETEQYKQIYYTFQSYTDTKGGISIKRNDGAYVSIGPPFSSRKEFYRATGSGEILLSNNSSNLVKVFTPSGGDYITSEFKLKGDPIPLTQEEKDEYYQNFKERLESNGMDASLAEKMKEPGYFPDHLPYYYNVIVDDRNNCLFFMYSNENEDYLFQAYSTDGSFLGESEFKIEGYDLLSKLGNFKFVDGWVYTLALKHNEEKSMRILKCKIMSQ